jgi:flagellar biosynthesis protein FliQ
MPFYLVLLRQAFTVEITALAPIIFVLLAISVGTAIFQAAFQIEDATFALLLKTLAMIVMVLVGGASFLQGFALLTTFWIGHAGAFIHMPWF